MKAIGIVPALFLSLLATSSVLAQDRPPARLAHADVFGSIGWFNADKGELVEYNDWYNRSVFGGGTAGWYWTNHLKTEVDIGATSRARVYSYDTFFIGNTPTTRASEFYFKTRRIALSQQYQFRDNTWFHPHLAAGVDFTAEGIEQEDEPVFTFDQATRTTRLVSPELIHPERTEWHTRPFIAGGFKAYMTPRSFFRTDMRFVFKDGVDEVLLRFGFGVDF
jgi:hypothetical protein